MSTEQYGIYSIYLSWLQVFTVISTLYLYHGVTDNAMSKFEDDRSRFISSMQGLSICITTIVMLLVLFLWKGIKSFLGLAPIMVMLMFAEIYVTPALAFWSARQRFEYKYRNLVLITTLKSLMNPCLGIVAVMLFEDKATARAISTVIVEFMICGTIMVLQFVKGRTFYEHKYWKYAITLAIPMLPHYLSGIILNHGDRIVIAKLVGNTAVALYGVAYSIGWLVQIFIRAINSALTPWIYGRLKTSDIKEIQTKSRSVLVFIFILSVGLMLISPEVVYVFGSSKYVDAINVIPPVAGSVFFVFLYGFLSFPEFYYEKTSFLMVSSVVAAVLNIILNILFVPIYGYIAAAYTTLACYVLYSLGHYVVSRRVLKGITGYRSIIDEFFGGILSVVIILISCTVHYLYGWMIIRYLLIAIGIVVMVWKRKTILQLLKQK